MSNTVNLDSRPWVELVDQYCDPITTRFDEALDAIERALGAKVVIASTRGSRRSLGPDHRIALGAVEHLVSLLTAGRSRPDGKSAAAGMGGVDIAAILIAGRQRMLKRLEEGTESDEAPIADTQPPEPPPPREWTSHKDYASGDQALAFLVAAREDRIRQLFQTGLEVIEGALLAQRSVRPKARRTEAIDAGPDYPTALRAMRLLALMMTAGRAIPPRKSPEERDWERNLAALLQAGRERVAKIRQEEEEERLRAGREGKAGEPTE
jgi:hypothetical protein